MAKMTVERALLVMVTSNSKYTQVSNEIITNPGGTYVS